MEFAYKDRHLHFVGVGGVSMSGLIRIARRLGARVTGSDRTDSDALRALQKEGYAVYVGHDPKVAAECDLLVYTSAVAPDDPERKAAEYQMERSVLLGEIAALYPTVIAVAGTHGKTTVSGMIASILLEAGVPFTAHIGGTVRGENSGTYIGGDRVFLTEACEYRRHFLQLRPTVGVVTNVEHDHPDCYPALDDVYRAFEAFGKQSRAVVTEDERLICALAHTNTSTYLPACIRTGQNGEKAICEEDGKAIPIELQVWGDFNVKNAAFAIRVATLLGIDDAHIAEGLRRYRGVERRQETVGTLNGMPLISDYAHHPTEISALTQAATERYGRIAVVFEPHTYSRTQALLAEFGTCFHAECVYLLPTYAAREEKAEGVEEALLDAICVQNKTCADKATTLRYLCELPRGYYGAILFVGAGSIHTFAKQVAALEQK